MSEIRKERGEEETGETGDLADPGNDPLQFEIEMAQPFVLISTG